MRYKPGKFRVGRVLMLALMLALTATRWSASAADEDLAIQTELIAEVRETVHVGPDRDAVRFAPATVLSQGQVVYYTVRIVNRSPVVRPSNVPSPSCSARWNPVCRLADQAIAACGSTYVG